AQLLPLIDDNLRQLDTAELAHEKSGQMVDAMALVYEAYLRFAGDQPFTSDRSCFTAAPRAMRHISVERLYRGQNSGRDGRPAILLLFVSAARRCRLDRAETLTPKALVDRCRTLTALATVLDQPGRECDDRGKEQRLKSSIPTRTGATNTQAGGRIANA